MFREEGDPTAELAAPAANEVVATMVTRVVKCILLCRLAFLWHVDAPTGESMETEAGKKAQLGLGATLRRFIYDGFVW